MQLIPWSKLMTYQAISMTIVFGISMGVCWVWELLMANSDIEVLFKGKALFDLLSIVVGFTYVGVVRDFLSLLTEKSKLFAKIKLLILKDPQSAMEYKVKLALHYAEHSEHNPVTSQLSPEWLEIYGEIFIDENVETGTFFNWSGPYLAMGVYFVVHPPLVYKEDAFFEWSLVYAASVTILFSFIVTLWYVEEHVLKYALKNDIVKFAREVRRKSGDSADSTRGYGEGRSLNW